MGVITSTLLTTGSATGSGGTTDSVSLSANSLILVAVAGEKGSTANPLTPTLSGASRTWTQVSTYEPGADRRLTIFRSLSSTANSGALTISGADSGTLLYWIVVEFKNVAVTGTNGSDAVVQTGSNQVGSGSSSTGLTITLSAFTKPSNAAVGFIQCQNLGSIGGFAVGSGFTSIAYLDRLAGEFNPIADNTVNWTWSSQSNEWMATALEIKSAPRGGSFLYNLT